MKLISRSLALKKFKTTYNMKTHGVVNTCLVLRWVGLIQILGEMVATICSAR